MKRKKKRYVVCIFESKKTRRRFIDFTGEKLSVKLNEFNKGKKLGKWFLENRPFKAVYCEKYETRKEAEERVHELKTENRIPGPIPKTVLKGFKIS